MQVLIKMSKNNKSFNEAELKEWFDHYAESLSSEAPKEKDLKASWTRSTSIGRGTRFFFGTPLVTLMNHLIQNEMHTLMDGFKYLTSTRFNALKKQSQSNHH